MRIAQINVVSSLSTGRIAVALCRLIQHEGHRAVICHSRDHAPTDVPSIRIGSKIDTTVHAVMARLTDRSGQIAPIEIPVPDRIYSQSPNPVERPYATVNLYARANGFEQIENENLQVFADTTTNQDLLMIPLSELPGAWDKTEVFDTPPQNL